MNKVSKRSIAESTSTNAKRSPAARKTKPRETKRAQLIRMLKKANGVDVAEIGQKLGWQKHTTRAALTGLRKAGFTIERSTINGSGALSAPRARFRVLP